MFQKNKTKMNRFTKKNMNKKNILKFQEQTHTHTHIPAAAAATLGKSKYELSIHRERTIMTMSSS